ncbi:MULTISPECIES: ABC transporter transmembrane domain-containing protein [Roseobacteraceae]|uniref:ABC transporter transmembrane domain-containing protein n=1 Tax=Roseobacteraceae TaxID=2854170 RepID=UPI003299F2DB
MSEVSVLKSVTWDPAILAASLMANLLSLAVPLAMLQIYDRVIPNQAHETLIVLAAMVALALAVDCVLRLSRARLLAFCAGQFEQLAYTRVFWAQLMEDPAQRIRADAGTRVTQMTAIDRLRSQRADGAAAAMLDLPFAGLFLAVMAFLSPVVALTVAVMLALTFVALSFLRRRVDKARTDRFETDARRYSFFTEVLGGIKSVRALQIRQLMTRRQERLLTRSASQTHDITRGIHHAQGLTAAIGNIVPLVTAATAGFLVVSGQASIGVLAAVVVLSGRVVQPVLRVEGYLSSMENARQAEADLAALTDGAQRVSGQTPLRRVDSFSLCDVITRPDPEFGIVMENININLNRGDCLLLRSDDPVGLSVAARLFLGELALEQGRIEINGHPADEYHIRDRQDRVRLLSEDAQLLEGTLFDNICAFRPDRHSETAIQLARELGLQSVMGFSPRGLLTPVRADNDGLPQSAQRIVSNICGLVTLPDVVIFQTANSGLDLETDQKLLSWLKKRAADHILILISNRPSYMVLTTQTLDLSDHKRILQDAV